MGPKSMNFIRRLKRGNFFCARVSKNIDLSGVWTLATNAKFQHNISKTVPARQKNKHRAMGCEYQYSYNFHQASLNKAYRPNAHLLYIVMPHNGSIIFYIIIITT